jgi:hypothetical protein
MSLETFLGCSVLLSGFKFQLRFSQGFSLDYSELREYTHGFFSNVAEILEGGLAPVCLLSSSVFTS